MEHQPWQPGDGQPVDDPALFWLAQGGGDDAWEKCQYNIYKYTVNCQIFALNLKKKFTLAKKNLQEYICGARDKYEVCRAQLPRNSATELSTTSFFGVILTGKGDIPEVVEQLAKW